MLLYGDAFAQETLSGTALKSCPGIGVVRVILHTKIFFKGTKRFKSLYWVFLLKWLLLLNYKNVIY